MASSNDHEWVSVIFPADDEQPITNELFCKKCGISSDEANGAWGDMTCCDEFKEIVQSHTLGEPGWIDNEKLRVIVNGRLGWFTKRSYSCKDCGLLLRFDIIHGDGFVIHCAETFSDYGYKEVLRHCRELRMRKALT